MEELDELDDFKEEFKENFFYDFPKDLEDIVYDLFETKESTSTKDWFIEVDVEKTGELQENLDFYFYHLDEKNPIFLALHWENGINNGTRLNDYNIDTYNIDILNDLKINSNRILLKKKDIEQKKEIEEKRRKIIEDKRKMKKLKKEKMKKINENYNIDFTL